MSFDEAMNFISKAELPLVINLHEDMMETKCEFGIVHTLSCNLLEYDGSCRFLEYIILQNENIRLTLSKISWGENQSVEVTQCEHSPFTKYMSFANAVKTILINNDLVFSRQAYVDEDCAEYLMYMNAEDSLNGVAKYNAKYGMQSHFTTDDIYATDWYVTEIPNEFITSY